MRLDIGHLDQGDPVKTTEGKTPLIHRRAVLAAGVGGLLALSPVGAAARALSGERRLRLHSIHTGESLSRVYWQDGHYVGESLAEINRLLRDWRTGDVVEMDVGVLDLLSDLHRRLEATSPFEIISGYRSPHTNASLRTNGGGGVAKKSLHMRGMAVDVSLPGHDLRRLQKAAVAMKRGGVGYYGKSGFIHVDTGRVRYW